MRILLALIAAPALAQSPVAIECKMSDGTVETYVLDDAKQTIRRFDAETLSLNDPCPLESCRWSYGFLEIRHMEVKKEGLLNFVSLFRLNRVTGSLKRNFDRLGSTGADKTLTGTCAPTRMPNLTPPKRKF